MWGKRNTNALLVGVQEGTAALDFSVVICQKIRKKMPHNSRKHRQQIVTYMGLMYTYMGERKYKIS